MSVLQGSLTDGFALLSHGCDCASHILQSYAGVPVAKAMRLDTPGEFDRAVARLALALRQHAQEPEQQAFRAALEALDVDWLSTTAGQRPRAPQPRQAGCRASRAGCARRSARDAV